MIVIGEYALQERSFCMEQDQKKLSPKQKLNIAFATLAGLGIGGVLGIIAYYQHWLG